MWLSPGAAPGETWRRQRPEYLCDTIASGDIGVVQKPLTVWQRLVSQAWLRKAFILLVIGVAWQAYAYQLNNPLLVPTFTATLEAFQADPDWQAAVVESHLDGPIVHHIENRIIAPWERKVARAIVPSRTRCHQSNSRSE